MSQPSKNPSQISSKLDFDNPLNEEGVFGNRYLTDPSKVYEFNSWDKVEFTQQELEAALNVIEQQKKAPVPEEKQHEYHENAAQFWDEFYSHNQNKFFKDRNWLDREFPELFDMERLKQAQEKQESYVVAEIGCGVGNTIFPLIQKGEGMPLFVYGFDYAETAIRIVKENKLYDETRCKAFVYDLSSPIPPPEIPPGSVDICTCIFVLSALHPDTWAQAVSNIRTILKPGGLLLLRDYGRHDLAQLRFKANRLLSDNFYIRGDGTRVYFFTNEEIESMFSGFEVLQNGMDRRLLTNRHRQLTMHRAWIQAKLRKPL